MAKVTAKFRCNSVTDFGQQKKVDLSAVTSGSEENKSFAKYTPNGSLTVTVDSGTIANNYFEPGKEYYLSISSEPEKDACGTCVHIEPVDTCSN